MQPGVRSIFWGGGEYVREQQADRWWARVRSKVADHWSLVGRSLGWSRSVAAKSLHILGRTIVVGVACLGREAVCLW